MINFEKFAQEGHEFVNELSRNLGHENDKAQVGILLRGVLHVLRDSLSIPQSLHVLAQLPMFLKAIYVEQWRYTETPHKIRTIKAFANKVEEEQRKFGERQFDWSESTEAIVRTIFATLYKYLSEGQIHNMIAELPSELKSLFPEGEKIHKG